MAYNPPYNNPSYQYGIRGPPAVAPQQDAQNPQGVYPPGPAQQPTNYYAPPYAPHMAYDHRGAPPPPPPPPPPPQHPYGPGHGQPQLHQPPSYYPTQAGQDPRDTRHFSDMNYPTTSQFPAATMGHPPGRPPPQPQPGSRQPIPTRGTVDFYMPDAATGFWPPPPPQDHSAGPASRPSPQQPTGGPAPAGPPPQPAQRNAQQNAAQARQAPPRFNEDDLKTTAQFTFDRFDVDKGGYLDLQEFLDAMRALHYTLAYHDAIDRFHRADSNNNGRISKEEFVKMYVEEMRNKYSY